MLRLSLLFLSSCVFVDDTALKDRLDPDGDGAAWPDDCESEDPAVHPGADEVCDGIDQDCDGMVDEEVGLTLYIDADEDGFGDPEAAQVVCEPRAGLVENATDCDDGDAGVFPGADETCDGADQDCDGVTDEDAVDVATWFADVDGDGFGNAGSSVTACDAPDAHVGNASDCDDADALAYPGADETCDPGDDDCDGAVDEDAIDAPLWYADGDADGFGDPLAAVAACAAPDGFVAHAQDCDDSRGDVSPDGVEVCGDVDEDCDGAEDEDAIDASLWYADFDVDGFGEPGTGVAACAAPGGHVADATDCDDARGDVSPDGVEMCGDVDEDCDGAEDEDAIDALLWHADADGDGYGEPGSGVAECTAPAGHVADATDCDDARADVSPSASEVCDAADTDEDCDGDAEDADADATRKSAAWVDADADGYGAGAATSWCDIPAGYALVDGDCDDRDAGVSPAAAERWYDGVDGDCDGASDYDQDGDGWDAELHLGEDCDDLDATVHPAAWDGPSDAVDRNCDGDTAAVEARVATATITDESGWSFGSYGQTMAGDYDGDGTPDLLVCGYYNSPASYGPLTTFSGAGILDADRTLDDRAGHLRSHLGGPCTLAAGSDYDRDGVDDVFVGVPGQSEYTPGQVFVLSGASLLDGDQTMSAASIADIQTISGNYAFGAGWGGAGVVPLGDLDADGRTDVAASSMQEDTVWVFGSATFRGGGSFDTSHADVVVAGPSGGNCEAVEATDVDGDGTADLFVQCYGAASSIYFGGTLTSGATSLSAADADATWGDGDGITRTVAADFDGDGYSDLASTVDYSVLLFPGDLLAAGFAATTADAWLEITSPSGETLGHTLRAGDLDADGQPDLLTSAHQDSGLGRVDLFLAPGTRSGSVDLDTAEYSFRGDSVSDADLYRAGIGVHDLDTDGMLDVALIAEGSRSALLFQNPL